MKFAFLAPLALGVALSGCAALNGLSIVAGVTVNPNYAYAAVQAFNATETTADAYLRLPACVYEGPVACRNRGVVAKIVPLIRTGRVARNAVVAALHASNGGPIPVANYNALQSAIDTLNSVYTNYGVAKTGG